LHLCSIYYEGAGPGAKKGHEMTPAERKSFAKVVVHGSDTTNVIIGKTVG